MVNKELILDLLNRVGKSKEVQYFTETYSQLENTKFGIIMISSSLSSQITLVLREIELMNQLGIYPFIVLESGVDLHHVQSFPNVKVNKRSSEKFDIDFDALKQALSSKKSPVINYQDTLKHDYITTEAVVRYLLSTFQPEKIIYLDDNGGLKDKDGADLSFINGFELDLMKDRISSSDFDLVCMLRNFLEFITYGSAVITKPEHLLQELLTVKGQGTFIKVHHIINDTFDRSDEHNIAKCLELSFNKRLVAHYFSKPIHDLFYQREFEGVAIIKLLAGKYPYLDKFAVKPLFSGTGLGKSLFHHVLDKYPNLIWRSSLDNPLKTFYFNYSDGHVKTVNWIIYWRGFEKFELDSIIEEVGQLERDII